jgi:hypothetical protein
MSDLYSLLSEEEESPRRRNLPEIDIMGETRAPDEVAADRQVAETVGQPYPAIRAYPELFGRVAEQRRLEGATEGAPRLRGWLGNPDNTAIARDDVEALATFERVGQAIARAQAPAPRRRQSLAERLFVGVHRAALGRAESADIQNAADIGSIAALASPFTAPFGAAYIAARQGQPSRDLLGDEQGRQGDLDAEHAGLAFRRYQAQLRGEALEPEALARLDELATREGQENWGPFIIGPTRRLLPQIIGALERGGEQAIERVEENAATIGNPWELQPGERWTARRVLEGVAATPVAAGMHVVTTPLAGLGGAVGGYLGFGNEMETGIAFDQMVRAGVDPDIAAERATEYGAWATAIEFAGEALGLRLSGATRLVRRAFGPERALAQSSSRVAFGQAVAGAAIDQGFEEATQELAQIIHSELAQQDTSRGYRLPGGDLDSPASEAISWERLKALGSAWREALTPDNIKTILMAGYYGAQAGAGMGSVPASANFFLDLRAAQRAEQNVRIFEEMVRASQGSKVGERLPSALESAVSAMDESRVYIDAERFIEHFQDAGANAYAVAEELGVGAETLARAVQSNGLVELPTATFAARVLRVPAHAGLAEHARFSPTDFTQAEEKMAVEVFLAELERLAGEVETVTADNEIGAMVEKRVRELFQAAEQDGGPRPEIARRYAKLVAALPRALLARARASGDAEYAARLEARLRALFGENLDIAGPGRDVRQSDDAAEMEQGRGSGPDGAPIRNNRWAPPEGVKISERQRKIAEMAINGASNQWIAEEMADGDKIPSLANIGVTLNRVKKELAKAGVAVPWEEGRRGGAVGVNTRTGEQVVTEERLAERRDELIAAGHPKRGIIALLAEQYGMKPSTVKVRLWRHDQAKKRREAEERGVRREQPFDLHTAEGRAEWFADEVLAEHIPGEASDARNYGFALDTGEIIVMSIAPEPTGSATVEWTFLDRLKDQAADPDSDVDMFGPGKEKLGVRGVLAVMARVAAVLEADMAQFKRDSYVYTPNNEALDGIYKMLVNRVVTATPYKTIDDGAGTAYLVRDGAEIARNGTVIPSPENANVKVEWPQVDAEEVRELQNQYYERLERFAKGEPVEGDRGAGGQADADRGSAEAGGGVSGPGRRGDGGELGQDQPIFYSAVERAVGQSKTVRAPGSQWWATISKTPGVKKEELEWIGLEDWLKAQEKNVSREDVLNFVRENGVQVEETVLGERAALTAEQQQERLLIIEEMERISADDRRYGPDAARIERWGELEEQIAPLNEIMHSAAGTDRTKWSQYTLPGGENYREVLLRLPRRQTAREAADAYNALWQELHTKYGDGFHERATEEELATLASLNEASTQTGSQNFQSSHFDQPNILAHVRFNERTDANGRRTLFIEEVQSDWHQAGRERGYGPVETQAVDTGNPDNPFNGAPIISRNTVPDAPFKNNAWASLAMKRMIRWAAENGFDQIAWTRGQHQVERFNLGREINRIYFNPETREFTALARGGGAHQESNVTDVRLAELIGKEGAKQVLEAPRNRDGEHEIAASDITIGGEGMRAFYDKILPNIANDLGKKFGARVGETQIAITPEAIEAVAQEAERTAAEREAIGEIGDAQDWRNQAAEDRQRPTGTESVHSLPITPEMREAAMEGQALFQGERRGSIRYEGFRAGEFGETAIRLFKAFDLSTVIHESGHLFHIILESIATDPEAPAEFKQMWENTLAWWGESVDGRPMTQAQWDALGAAVPDDATRASYVRKLQAEGVQPTEANILSRYRTDLKRPYFEKWAVTFEAYAMDGKAPSVRLREAFAAFREWLTRFVYRALRIEGANLTPEIRDVFDRLLATDAEIAEARAAMGADFSLARDAFKTDEEFAKYQQAIADAKEAADAELRARVMDAHIRKEKRWWRAERSRVRKTAERIVDSDPARRAYEWLAFNEWRPLETETNDEGAEVSPDASLAMPEDLPEMKLSAAAMADEYGDGAFDGLPVGLRPLRAEDVDAALENAMALKRQARTRQPQRLWSFIKAQGGIKDEGGEITQALGSARLRPGLINNATGVDAGELALRAWEAGYFGAVPRKGEFNQGPNAPDAGQSGAGNMPAAARLREFLQDDTPLAQRYQVNDRLVADGRVVDVVEANESTLRVRDLNTGEERKIPRTYAQLEPAPHELWANGTAANAPDGGARGRETTRRAVIAGLAGMGAAGKARAQTGDVVSQARAEFPRLAPVLDEMAVRTSPDADGRMLEFYPRGERDSFDPTRNALEVFGDRATPLDVVGDIVSHDLARGRDPTLTRYYQQFEASMTPQQQAMLREQYEWARRNAGETRSFEDWRDISGQPAFFRGYAFRQWENPQQIYTPQQMRMFDEMMGYLRGGGPGFELFQGEDDGAADRRPTPRELIDALVDDIKNIRQVYSSKDEAAVAAYQNRADQLRWFEARDIDLNGSKEEIRAQIVDALTKEAAVEGGGWHPDDIAPWFGFESGDAMIQAMKRLAPRNVAIEQEIERRLEGEHGDPFRDGLIAEEARLAAHVEAQARKIEMELEAIQRATAGRRTPVGRAARAYAEQQIERMTVKQIRGYESYLAGERRAARNAMEAVQKGDMVEAGVWKQRQLVSFHLYRLARDAAEEMDKAQRYFQKFDRDGVRSNIHPPLLDQIDQALEGVDLRARPFMSNKRRQSFLNWFQEMQAEGLEHMVAVDPDFLEQVRQRPFNALTLEEARAMRDAVRNFEHIGRRWREVLDARDQRLLDEEVARMAASMAGVKPIAFTKPEDHSPGLVESIDLKRQGFHAQLSRVEFIARAMDGMKENGPVWNGLFRPLTEARDREEVRQETAQQAIENLFSVYSAKERADMWVVKKHYPQVPNRDGSAMGRSFTKQEILSLALNTGNEYNWQALLEGEARTSRTTEAQIRALLDASMDARDWAFVQSLWDYVDGFYPEIEQLYLKTAGVAPAKVRPTPFVNRFGEWRGGYWPAVYDFGRDQRAREEFEHGRIQEAFGGFRLASQTPNSFAKARQGSGGRPIRLDLGVLSEHVNGVIHDLEFRLPVLNAWRLIKHSGFREAFVRAAGQAQYDELKPWLQYIATERMPPERFFTGAVRQFRRNTPIALMGYAISTVAQQPAGLLGTMHRVGVGRVMGKAVELMAQPWTWMSHARFINSRSMLMKNRTLISQREIRDMVQELNSEGHIDAVNLLIAGNARQKAQALGRINKLMQRYALFPLAFVDKWVSSVAWKAAYDKALGGHVEGVNPQNEADVIAYADHIIRTTFGSGRPEDLSPIMRSSEIGKLITPAFSYFNTQYNQLYNEQTPGMMRGQISPLEFMTYITLTLVLQALVSEWMAGRWDPDDDEDEEERNVRIGVAVAQTPFAGVPLIRDISRAALNKASTGERQFGQSVPAVGAITTTGSGVGGAVYDLANEGELSRATARDLTMAAGYWFGIPSRQLWTTGSFVADVASGDEDAPWDSDEPVDAWSEAFLRDTR